MGAKAIKLGSWKIEKSNALNAFTIGTLSIPLIIDRGWLVKKPRLKKAEGFEKLIEKTTYGMVCVHLFSSLFSIFISPRKRETRQ